MTRARFLLAALVAAALLLPVGAGSAGESPAPSILRVTFYAEMFSTLNRDDGIAAIKSWTDSIARRRKIPVVPAVDTFVTPDELGRTVRNDADDLFIISGFQYVSLEQEQARLDPLFLPCKSTSPGDRYVLLTRRGARSSLADLRGARLLLLRTACTDLARLWLTVRLRTDGLGPLESLCVEATDVSKPSAAVLPVFFGQADACVVDEPGYELMKELNPQLGAALQVVAESPPYVESVICLRRDYQQYRAEVISGLAELEHEPAGRQMLTAFKINRLAPFADDALETLRELRAATSPRDEVASQ